MSKEKQEAGCIPGLNSPSVVDAVPLPAPSLTTSQLAKRARKRARREARIEGCEPVCVECGKLAELVKGDRIYPHRADLHVKNFYLCECGAYVGCHPFTRIALGRPAGDVTRKARNRAHNAFDILWRRKMRVQKVDQPTARRAAYDWLADQLGYERGQCHVGWMTADEARAVARLCDPYVHRRPANTPTPEGGAGYGTASTTDASQALRDEHQTATGEKG